MTDEATQSEIHKIEQTALAATGILAAAAAEVKTTISQAAATALSTFTVASAVQQKDIDYIRKTIDSLIMKFDLLGNIYVAKNDLEPIKEIQIDHEKRIRTNEQFTWKMIGALIVSDMLLVIGIPIILFVLQK